jgi:hypothetical protein
VPFLSVMLSLASFIFFVVRCLMQIRPTVVTSMGALVLVLLVINWILYTFYIIRAGIYAIVRGVRWVIRGEWLYKLGLRKRAITNRVEIRVDLAAATTGESETDPK